MRTIDTRWIDLSQGYKAVRKLESSLKGKWGTHLEGARQSRYARELAAWETAQAAKKTPESLRLQKRYEREMYHWRVQQKNYEQTLAAWQAELAREKRKFIAWLVVFILLCCSVVGLPVGLLVLYFVVRQYRAMRQVQQRRPIAPKEPELLSAKQMLKGAGSKPSMAKVPTPSLEIAPSWWKSLLARGKGEKDFGSIGVNDLLQSFTEGLPDTFIAIKELLVTPGLDADVLILGPTGIWILECKYLAGKVVYRRGEGWYQTKEFYREGGVLDVKRLPFEVDLDEQWLRERMNVVETIRRRLPAQAWLIPHIKGGIAFTHPETVLDIDLACKAEWGGIKKWLKTIRDSQPVPQLTAEVQLQVADALITFASKIGDESGTKSALDLAYLVHDQIVRQAQEYVKANTWN